MSTNKYYEWFNVYYSQNQEDLILRALFPTTESGFYIDVGAHDPEYFSVTKLFYDSGWSGINIEPQKKYHTKLSKSRERDINLNVAIGSKKSQLIFREYHDADGLSTMSETMKQEYINNKEYKEVTKKYSEYKVQVLTLNDIFEKYCKDKEVNFLKIDVEGFEKEALLGNNWAKNRPHVLCIESNHEEQEWHSILAKANYKTFFNDGLNEYFAANEVLNALRGDFNYPETVLRRIPLANTPLEFFAKEMNAIEQDNKTKQKQISKQDSFIKNQQDTITNLNGRIDQLNATIDGLEKENSKLPAKLALRFQRLIQRRK